jgi:hypothetical protein
MKTSQAFKKIRWRIAARQETYICVAAAAICGGPAEKRAAGRAKDVVVKRMGPTYEGYSLTLWLHKQAGIPSGRLTPAAMRAYRLRWLDALIEEFEAKGD